MSNRFQTCSMNSNTANNINNNKTTNSFQSIANHKPYFNYGRQATSEEIASINRMPIPPSLSNNR